MDVILVSTTDRAGARQEVLARMLASMARSSETLGAHRLRLALLWQNTSASALTELCSAPYLESSAVPGRLSLSAARNTLLAGLAARGAIDPDALLAFPDDDCWYPEGFLAQVAELFVTQPSLDLWFCRYSSAPLVETQIGALSAGQPSAGTLVRNASSNTIFVRGRIVSAIGPFDETLGVGTPLGGAEDLDYALRAWRVARRVAYADAPLVGHRDKSSALRARYYPSGLLVLGRHARHGVFGPFVRKIAVGLYLVLRGELPIASFASALRGALAAAHDAGASPLRPVRSDP